MCSTGIVLLSVFVDYVSVEYLSVEYAVYTIYSSSTSFILLFESEVMYDNEPKMNKVYNHCYGFDYITVECRGCSVEPTPFRRLYITEVSASDTTTLYSVLNDESRRPDSQVS